MVDPRKELVPIRTVSRLTGVNPVTLRAWERRYGLIKPQRTPKGHRLYSRQDIDLISRVLDLLDRGMSIGQVRSALETEQSQDVSEAHDDKWQQYRANMIKAIATFDEASLEDVYNEALALYPVNVVTRLLVVPMLEEIGRRWESGEGSVAEEHFFGCYLRNKLGARFHHRPRHIGGSRLVMACLPEQYHEIGLLLFALAASTRAYDTVLLGANLPLEEIPLAVSRSRGDAVVLSSSTEPAEETLSQSLVSLVEAVKVPVFVGGRFSDEAIEKITDAGAIFLGDEIETGLRLMREHLDARGRAGVA
ncbi:MerR family transcriptional regulator [Gammaproteobacteria bacterium AB-CW1]|uniref:MerR family transcriptional regulator n=1 Tax=Natronospira elongata TaxID=3110268 RepID=A0AAP6JF92_9GAMM|nr:MerR family transcriptional regulator [Gammaproteobacteria bacterium AB-CW1]